jgi:exodeoxyribonuclease V alpha subunit
MDELINNKLNSLSKSKFRSSFHLKTRDINYIKKLGIYKIKEHAYDFINKRIAPAIILNDGKQTPMHNHPVFIAQHATATCCRGCLYKWHHIEQNRELTKQEIDYIVTIIMEWIRREMIRYEQNF